MITLLTKTQDLSQIYKSSHSEVFLRKGVLKICSKFTGEHPFRRSISIKLQSNFIEIALRRGCSLVNFRIPYSRNTSGWLPLNINKTNTQINEIIKLEKLVHNETKLLFRGFPSNIISKIPWLSLNFWDSSSLM